MLDDAATAVAALRSPELATAHRLSPDRLAVVGHSAGGFTALMTAAADPTVRAVVSVAGADLGTIAALTTADPAVRAEWVEIFGDDLLPLRGTSGEALVAELEAAGPAWRLAGLAPRLEDRPVLLIAGARDMAAVAAVHHEPLVAAYRSNARLEHRLFPTDHALSDHRVELAETVRSFLDRHL
jgi:pimeloyl-ACP methyl ester carboxylesterase